MMTIYDSKLKRDIEIKPDLMTVIGYVSGIIFSLACWCFVVVVFMFL